LLLGDKNFVSSAGFLPHIARVSVSGVITNDRKMNELLDKIGKSDQVKAVILEINSPGGTTTGGEAMYDSIRQLAKKKPVVAVCEAAATSGRLYRGARHRSHLRLGQHHHRLGWRAVQMGRCDRPSSRARHQGRGGEERAVEGGAKPLRADR